MPAHAQTELTGASERGLEPPGKTEDAGDYYIVGGERIKLLRAPDEVAVRYKKKVDEAQGFEALSKSAGVGNVKKVTSFKPKGIDIVGRNGAQPKGIAPLNEAVKQDPNVEQAFPVFVSPQDMTRMVALDEILVCLKPDAKIEDIEAQLTALGATVVEKQPATDINVYLVRLTAPDQLGALAASVRMMEWPQVEWAEPNFLREIKLSYTPNDPLFPQQQSHHNTGQNGGLADADVDAPEAWDVTRGSSNIVIAIIDDGVDTSHPDLNIQPGGYDFLNNDSDPNPSGTDGHGTGCAGVAAAKGNNALRAAGVAGDCKILPIKVCSSTFATDLVLGNAIRYAADRADILSNSWGGGSPNSYINTAIDYALASGRGGKGSAVFFATGNGASSWYNGGPRCRLPLNLTGNYYIAFFYVKDLSDSVGSDWVTIDNVSVLEADGYTHRWRQDFEGSFPPSGWSTGSPAWFRTNSGALTGTGGTYSARSADISDSGSTYLLTSMQSLTGTETLAFAYSTSTEPNYDFLQVHIYDQSFQWVIGWNIASGNPTPVSDAIYPASYANSISVGACTDRDRRSDYSQYGSALDFVAPSNGGWNDIVTLDPTGDVGWTSTDYKTSFGGTSSACPLAAGIGALILSRNPDLSATSLLHVMRSTCDKIGGVTYTSGFNTYYGYGRVNAAKALNSLCTVDAHSSPAPDLTLPDSNDTEAEKMTALKFRITDWGQDSRNLLIDQLKVKIGGTGGHAAHDIAWAELRDATTRLATATGSAITDTQITFGIAPNNNSQATVRSISDNTYIEFTVNLYLRAPLTALHDQTYTFDIDETCIGVDSSASSSQMLADSGAVTPVTGTLFASELAITVSPQSWTIGAQPLAYVGESAPFTVQNDGNVAADVTIMGTNGANGWNLAGAPGTDAFAVGIDQGDNGTYDFNLTTTAQALCTNLVASDSAAVGLRYSAPLADTRGGGVAHDFSITLSASRHVP